MEARLVLVLTAFTLALCSHVITAMQIPPSQDDVSDVTRDDMDSDDSTVDLHSLFRLEQYLYNIRNKLDRAHQLYDTGAQASREEPEAAYHMIANTKRKAPSGFYSVRGRRTEEVMTSQDGAESQGQGESDLLRLLDYYRALQAKRTSGGQYMEEKRQPPPRGFHAVRGKRSQPLRPLY